MLLVYRPGLKFIGQRKTRTAATRTTQPCLKGVIYGTDAVPAWSLTKPDAARNRTTLLEHCNGWPGPKTVIFVRLNPKYKLPNLVVLYFNHCLTMT